MEISKEDKWFSSLTRKQQEHIATKVKSKELGVLTPIDYPESTKVWLELSDVKKAKVHEHCEKDHDFYELPYKEGQSMSY